MLLAALSSPTRAFFAVTKAGVLRRLAAATHQSEGRGFGEKKHSQPEAFPSIDEFAKGKSLLQGMTNLADLAANKKESAFEKLVYPSPFTLKIVGENSEEFVKGVLTTLSQCIDNPSSTIPHSTLVSKGGNKYLSVTATPTFSNANQILQAYEKLAALKGIKFVL